MAEQGSKLSNPFSTGGGGPNYENSVHTYFAIHIITGDNLPFEGLPIIVKMKLQGRYAGYNTDDCILFGNDNSKCFCQIKHSIAITESDVQFDDVIHNAWKDFSNKELFDEDKDQIALVVAGLSATDKNDAAVLFDWARHCEDESEFIKKTNTNQFSSNEKRKKLNVIKDLLSNASGREISDYELWSFMKHFRLLVLELDSAETPLWIAASIILHRATGQDGLINLLYRYIADCNQSAGTITHEQLLSKLQINAMIHSPILDKVNNHNKVITASISNSINGINIDRSNYIDMIDKALEDSNIVLVAGERGVGKSGVIKSYVDYIDSKTFNVFFRGEELNQSSISEVFAKLNWDFDTEQLNQISIEYQKRFIFIESLEKILENEYTKAFSDLVVFVSSHPGWKIVASIRNYALQQLSINFLQVAHIQTKIVSIDILSDEQFDVFRAKCDNNVFDQLTPEVLDLLKIPFFLDYALRAERMGYKISKNDTYNSIKNAIWDCVIRNESNRQSGLPAKREQTFIEIAVQRAKQMKYAIRSNSFDPEVVQILEADGLISYHDSTVSITHDVLEDLALERWIEECFCKYSDSIDQFFSCIGFEQSICRAYRLWLIDKFADVEFLQNFTETVFSMISKDEYSIWIDETIVAILFSNKLNVILKSMRGFLFSQQQVLTKICFMLRVTAKKPNDGFVELANPTRITELPTFIVFKPYGECWSQFITFLYDNKGSLPIDFYSNCRELLSEWITCVSINQDDIPGLRKAGLLALYILSYNLKTSYSNKVALESLVKVAMVCYKEISAEFNQFVESLSTHDENKDDCYLKEVLSFILTDFSCCYIAKYNPNLLISIAKSQWLHKPNQFDDLYALPDYKPHEYGLQHIDKYERASGYREPFLSLFRFAPMEAINFVLELCNTAVNSFLSNTLSDKQPEEKQQIISELTYKMEKVDGTIIHQIVLPDLWYAYRGMGTTPGIIKCALMALENYLLEYFNQFKNDQNNLDALINYLVSKSNSVLITAVIVAIILANPSFRGTSILMLLQNVIFYKLDKDRLVFEYTPFFNKPNPYGKEQIFFNEREKANSYTWRKNDIETICIRLQFTDLKDEILKIIDQIDAQHPDDLFWKFCKCRIDSREFVYSKGKTDNEIIISSKLADEEVKQIEEENNERNKWVARYSKWSQWSDDILVNEKNDSVLTTSTSDCIIELKALITHYIKTNDKLFSIYRKGINQTIGILLRDHSSNLSPSDFEWCIDQLQNALNDYDNSLCEQEYRVPNSDGVLTYAYILPTLIDKISETQFWDLMTKVLISYDFEISINAAKGISKYLWDINPQAALKCISIINKYDSIKRSNNPPSSIFTKTKASNKKSSWIQNARILSNSETEKPIPELSIKTVTILLVMLSSKQEHYELVKFLFKESIMKICSVGDHLLNYVSIRDSDSESFFPMTKYFTTRIGEIFHNVSDFQLINLKDEATQLALSAPTVCKWVMYQYKVLCKNNHCYDHYWRFWNLLSDAAKEIVIESNISSNYRSQKRQEMLIEYMYTDYNWQPVDYQNMPVNSGVDYICAFAKETIGNPIVYEGLASLMYNFPDAFLAEGIKAQSNISREDLFQIFIRSSNAMFYMENNLYAYITHMETNVMPSNSFNTCKKLLDVLIMQASSKAYYIREYLLKSKRSN